ncbi:MAG TPA: TA system VapC family ribonuclease toxin [Rhodopila sp.]|uniref:TA system VapC family ribonuclease toxin n=1 Tax=Rhodopila sp. TaxID=2480087 RepID=UPI002B65E30E|nr:TA system VapC family ribonuclease toxin [Rhodopila sp.]HVY15339.1 TA system VapC family ribonuclease toxin [Rhodopila sp.]
MTYLLDVNVLVALMDPGHVAHDDAHRWFEIEGHAAWATCPITENGVIRIVGTPKYPNSPGVPSVIADMVRLLRTLPGHRFWPDDLSLAHAPDIDTTKILIPGQVTDTYLLALAKAHGGQLATFDRRLSVAAIRDGKAALHLIPSG